MVHSRMKKLAKRVLGAILLPPMAYLAVFELPEYSDLTRFARQPYLQLATPDSVVVRWATPVPSRSLVTVTKVSDLTARTYGSDRMARRHKVVLSGLESRTAYRYRVGDPPDGSIDTGPFQFKTPPRSEQPLDARVWVLGDPGTGDANAIAVMKGFQSYNGDHALDFLIALGDLAYPDGRESEYQRSLFGVYADILSEAPLWPALGNHDGHRSFSSLQKGPYFRLLTLPSNGEAGGATSHTEAYYAFDYGDAHFIALDSYGSDRTVDGEMATWLRRDLELTTDKRWTIAFWHHAPYTRGSHNSDHDRRGREMRENIVPILEEFEVDLVLGGHSHSYERSSMIEGHYGQSDSFDRGMIRGMRDEHDGTVRWRKTSKGTIYIVLGSSGEAKPGPLNHPAMEVGMSVLGSVVLDLRDDELLGTFVGTDGLALDRFAIHKD